MKAHETTTMSGRLNIVVKKADGSIKQEFETENLVVDTGLAYIADRMADAAEGAMSHMSIGSGTAVEAAADTTLGTELDRVALSSTTQTDNQVVYVASFGAGVGTGAVTEAGLFNANTAGTMLCRTKFDVVNKAADDSMTITWTITLSAS